MALSKMHEVKLIDCFVYKKVVSNSQTLVSSRHIQINMPTAQNHASSSNLNSNVQSLKQLLPIKRLIKEEMNIHREKGLCFNRDEKYNKNHKRKAKFLLLIENENEQIECVQNNAFLDEYEEYTCDDTTTITFHALNWASLPKTLKFTGTVNNKKILILVDSRSTHNFLQLRLIKYLGLVISCAPEFQVLTGNGGKLKCEGKCLDVSIWIQGVQFFETFYLLPIHRLDVVLRVQWLQN